MYRTLNRNYRVHGLLKGLVPPRDSSSLHHVLAEAEYSNQRRGRLCPPNRLIPGKCREHLLSLNCQTDLKQNYDETNFMITN